jgi:hypothetical protein
MEHLDAVPTSQFGPRKIKWDEVVKEVRANGGKWGRVGVFSPSVATHIRAGRYPAVDPNEFEVTTRKVEGQPGKSTLYIRVREDV